MATYKIKNWLDFQHYKDRCPPWIKLHYELMTSKDWVKFDDASKLLAVVCMMLGSRSEGIIEDDLDYLQQVAHLRKRPDLKPLIDSGFLVLTSDSLADASTMQADAIIEERREEKNISEFFEKFWKEYPKKTDKAAALLKFKTKVKDFDAVMAGLEKYKARLAKEKTEAQYIKHAKTWLNGECWKDEGEIAATGQATQRRYVGL